MRRALPLLRVTLAVLAAVWLGYLLFRDPSSAELPLGNLRGSMRIPRSLEGWKVEPGVGNTLLMGQTRLNLMALRVERIPVASSDDPQVYIAREHEKQSSLLPGYQPRLRGESRQFGQQMVPVSRAVYEGQFLWFTTTYVMHDGYWQCRGEHVRLRFWYPEFLEKYLWGDQYFIASNFRPLP